MTDRPAAHSVPRVVLWHLEPDLVGITDSSSMENEDPTLMATETPRDLAPSDLMQIRDTMTRLRHRAVPQCIVSDLPAEVVLMRLRQYGVAHYIDDVLDSKNVNGFLGQLRYSLSDTGCSAGPTRGDRVILVTTGERVPTWAASEGFSTLRVGGCLGCDAGSFSSTNNGPCQVDPADLPALLGVSGGEKALDDTEFERLYGAFARRTPEDVSHFLDGFAAPWYIASGWSLEAFSGVSRVHHDIDVCIQRSDLEAFQHHCAGRYDLWSASAGALKPIRLGDDEDALLPGCGQLWVRACATTQWEFDVLLSPGDGTEWICKIDESIRLGAREAWWSRSGVRYLAPHAALLMKAKQDRPQDRADLAATLPKMTSAQRGWLAESLSRLHPGHDWLATLN